MQYIHIYVGLTVCMAVLYSYQRDLKNMERIGKKKIAHGLVRCHSILKCSQCRRFTLMLMKSCLLHIHCKTASDILGKMQRFMFSHHTNLRLFARASRTDEDLKLSSELLIVTENLIELFHKILRFPRIWQVLWKMQKRKRKIASIYLAVTDYDENSGYWVGELLTCNIHQLPKHGTAIGFRLKKRGKLGYIYICAGSKMVILWLNAPQAVCEGQAAL